MYAIIETGGKQYRVQPGDEVHVEKIPGEVGDSVEIDRVLMYADEERLSVGTPVVENIKVKGHVLSHGRDKKIVIFKMKKRKKYRRKQGHRQSFTVLKIDEIAVEN
ncbi:MAG: 50S ribosomal protein L21 [bacterium]